MTNALFTIRPMRVGAEIVGFPSPGASSEARTALYDAWLQHGVLLFRDVRTAAQHLELSRCFGELELHPIENVRATENPLFMVVGGEKSLPYMYDETEVKVGTQAWHRDTAYTPDICKGAMLRLVETPAAGGETLFADTAAAYDDLPADVKDRLEGLEYKATLRRTPMQQTGPGALWTTVRPPTPADYAAPDGRQADYEATARSKSGYPTVVHPAVVRHPESGRACIFLSPKEFDGFLGMPEADSDELFRYLVGHMLQDRYVYRHHWAVNDAVLWDNRRFMHAAAGHRAGDHRRGLRTTLAGEWRVGRLYET